MKPTFSLLGSLLLAATVLEFQEAKANAFCMIRSQPHGRVLQLAYLYETNPPSGQILFTDIPHWNGTTWNLHPVENSTKLFRLENIQYRNQYLTLWKQNYCTTTPEDERNLEEFVWKLEKVSAEEYHLKHSATNLCMSVDFQYSPIPPYFRGFIPVMYENCTERSSIEIVCTV